MEFSGDDEFKKFFGQQDDGIEFWVDHRWGCVFCAQRYCATSFIKNYSLELYRKVYFISQNLSEHKYLYNYYKYVNQP